MKKIAIFPALGLGDGLLYMILSQNLSSQEGHAVTMFSSPLSLISRWFPGKTIHPFPHLDQYEEILSSFDLVISSQYSPIAHLRQPQTLLIKEDALDKRKTYVENLKIFCKEKFQIENAGSFNGIVVPNDVRKRRYPKRVAIHPMATDPKRIWSQHKFLKVAQKLASSSFTPTICVGKHEYDQWKGLPLENLHIEFPKFHDLDQFISYVAESGFIIGNDSGIGHFASNIDIPTLSLFSRKSYSKLWRPGWKEGIVVTPIPLLIGASLKTRYWQKMLTPQKVFRKFQKLERRH